MLVHPSGMRVFEALGYWESRKGLAEAGRLERPHERAFAHEATGGASR